MADSIKGKAYKKYSGDLQKGILLHRRIDTYTDSHPLVYKSAHRLFKRFRHYNGVIIDVFYDHFLAKNWQTYHPQNLGEYTQEFYALLEKNFALLPENVKQFYPYMKAQNWLFNYQDISGIERILFQMNTRVKGNFELHKSVAELRLYYSEFEQEFKTFFPQIQDYVAREKKQL